MANKKSDRFLKLVGKHQEKKKKIKFTGNLEDYLRLVEKNPKKCFFLNEVMRKLNLRVEVVNDNIYTLAPLNADILTTRAFSELNNLIEIAFRHRKKEGICLFLKGENYRIELDKTLNYWFFDYDVFDSLSNPSGKVIRVKKILKR